MREDADSSNVRRDPFLQEMWIQSVFSKEVFLGNHSKL